MMGKDPVEAIRYFGPKGKIWKIHFRNVTSPLPKFREAFIDHTGFFKERVMTLARLQIASPRDRIAHVVVHQRPSGRQSARAALPVIQAPPRIRDLRRRPGNHRWRERQTSGDMFGFFAFCCAAGLVIGDVIQGRVSDEWIVPIARSVRDQSGHARGVLVVGTRLSDFQQALRLQALPPVRWGRPQMERRSA